VPRPRDGGGEGEGGGGWGGGGRGGGDGGGGGGGGRLCGNNVVHTRSTSAGQYAEFSVPETDNEFSGSILTVGCGAVSVLVSMFPLPSRA